jgi:hypothetical protein
MDGKSAKDICSSFTDILVQSNSPEEKANTDAPLLFSAFKYNGGFWPPAAVAKVGNFVRYQSKSLCFLLFSLCLCDSIFSWYTIHGIVADLGYCILQIMSSAAIFLVWIILRLCLGICARLRPIGRIKFGRRLWVQRVLLNEVR